MIKTLKLYLDLNEIKDWEEILKAWEIVFNNPNRNIISYSQKWYILEYFHKLVNNEIDKEAYLKMWDINWSVYLYKKWVFLESLFEIYAILMDKNSQHHLANSIVLIEKYAYEYFKCYSQDKRNFVNKQVHILWSNICVL